MEPNSSEPANRTERKEIANILCYWILHYIVHEIPPPVSGLSQMNPLHIHLFCLSQMKHYATNQKVAGSIPDGSLGFLN
jgi:hypothetical protein